MPLNYHKLLIAHVAATLPQDIEARRQLLEAAIYTMPRLEGAPLRELLLQLNQHIVAQRELSLYADQANSTKPNESNPPGPGDGSGDGGHHPNDPEHKTK